MPETDAPPATPLAQAAVAAEELLEKLRNYEAALDEVAGLRSDVGALRDEVAAAAGPTRRVAEAAAAAARTYDAVVEARPGVEGALAALQSAAEGAAETVGERVEGAADGAARTIEVQASAAAERVATSAAALDGALGAAEAAARALEARVSDDGRGAADALVDALTEATAAVREDASSTLAGLIEPARQVGDAVVRAREAADATRQELVEAARELRGVLGREVAAAAASLRDGLAESEADFQRERSRDVGRLVRVAYATLAAVVLFGALSLARGCGQGGDPGVALDGAVVQVLNGVDPREDLAAEVAALIPSGPAGVVAAVYRGDAATSSQRETLILLHGASAEAGLGLAELLGVESGRVVRAAPLPLRGHMTVLVGDDYAEAIGEL